MKLNTEKCGYFSYTKSSKSLKVQALPPVEWSLLQLQQDGTWKINKDQIDNRLAILTQSMNKANSLMKKVSFWFFNG
jgi:hypothetical protein